MTRKIGIAIAVVVALAGVAGLSAQPARLADPPRPGAAIDQLLAEVQALRSDLNQAASASLRTQLLVARLQVQEGRIDSLGRQLADTREQLANAEQAGVALAAPLKMLDEAEKGSDEDQKAAQPMRELVAAAQKRTEELRVEESSLAALLAAEQSRWVEFNGRLEEIERMLAAPERR